MGMDTDDTATADAGLLDGGGMRSTSRRRLLALSAAAGAAAFGAAAGSELMSSPAGAAAGSPILIDETTTGAGGTTILEYTSGSSTLGSVFQAAFQDWGGQVFNVKAYGATGNGSTDDTAAIAAAQAAAGSGCVYFPAGTYSVTGLTVTSAGQTFKLEAGATIIAAAGVTGPVIGISAAGVSIFGPGTIDGNQSAQTGTTGLDCIQFTAGADDGLVEAVVTRNAAWYGIESIGTNRPRIVLNRVLNCNHGGISVSATSATVEGALIHGNMVELTGAGVHAGINVQGSSTSIVVDNPTITDNRVGITTAGIGYQVQFCPFARVSNNWGSAPAQVFSVVGGNDNVVAGNVAQSTGKGAGIELGSTFSVCTGNTVIKTSTATGCGINADNVSGTTVVIANNKVTGAVTQAIAVGSYDHVTITGNVLVQATTAETGFGVIEVAPSGVGLIVIGDNVIDGGGATQFGVFLDNLISTSIQTSIHDNAITGIPASAGGAAFRFAGAGTVTDLLVHDNLIDQAGSVPPLYTTTPGLTLGNNVRMHHNTIVGVVPNNDGTLGFGLNTLHLPASGTAYTNTSPFTEIVYIQGGKLTGTGTAQGVTKDGHVLAVASVPLKNPLSVMLDPGESITVYYTVAPTTYKDVKG